MSDDDDDTPKQPVDVSNLYHERQRLALCAVHSVNNLLQRPQFTKADFDAVCRDLSPDSYYVLNPHKSWLPGVGNYDVNVVSLVLQQQGLSVRWHDQRAALHLEADYDKDKLLGILWNVPSTWPWSRLTGGRHWVALLLLRDDNTWINLDSELAEPMVVGSDQDCIELLESKPSSHILFVQRQEKEAETE